QITSYTWNFGDNSSPGTTIGGSHTYSAAGTYTMQLNITNNFNCSSSTSTFVNVRNMPVVDFTATAVCHQVATTFTNLMSIPAPDQITKWRWDFGSGWMDSVSHDPVKTFPTSGFFLCKLEATSIYGC